MGCGESNSAAGVATGPCRPERRIAPLTATGSSGSQARGYRGARGAILQALARGPFASAGERRSLRRERDWRREAELP